MKRSMVLDICSSLLIILFLYTSITKLFDLPLFRHDLYNQTFPHWLAGFLFWTLPATEIVIAGLLVFRRTALVGFYMSTVLMVLFTLYTALVLFRFFKRVPCSCGGVIRKLTWDQHLVFNMIFLGLSVLGIYLIRRREDFTTISTRNEAIKAH